MPLYIADYLADTMRLTTIQHGAYLLLLMEYWRQGPLPDDDRELAAIAKADRKQWERDIAPVVRRFFQKQDDGLLHQKRIDSERQRAIELSEKRKAAGQQRGNKKVPHGEQLQEQTTSNSSANASVLQPSLSRDLSPSTKEDTSSLRSDDAVASPGPDDPGPKTKLKADPNDPKTILWNEGRAIVGRLASGGSDTPGSLVGKFVKDAKGADGSVNHALVLDVIREAEKQRPDQPIPWIRAAIKARVSPGGLFGASAAADPDDPGGVNAWCVANGVPQTTSPGDMQRAKWIVGGVLFDVMARDILLVAGMAFDLRYDWGPLRQWAESGIDGEAIYQTIKRMVTGMRDRDSYNAPTSLKFFDNTVRAAAGKRAA
jgi:uncharacterized protein YdaU (DUF1376 family)